MKEIVDKKSRKDTFHKRKLGLIKKAAELSILCNVKMLLVFEDLTGEIIKYSTHGIFDPVQYFKEGFLTSSIAFTAKHYPDFFKNITLKKGMKEEDLETEDQHEHNEESDEDDGNEVYMPSESDYPVNSEALSENYPVNESKFSHFSWF